MSACKRCGVEDRYKNGQCRPCARAIQARYYVKNAEKIKQRSRARHSANQEQRRATAKAWREGNREKHLTDLREYRAKNRERLNAQGREYGKTRGRFLKYGITKEDYQALLRRQGDVCAICLKAQEGRELCIDHCHFTGEVRGLLCVKCNSYLAIVEASPHALQRMSEYAAAAAKLRFQEVA